MKMTVWPLLESSVSKVKEVSTGDSVTQYDPVCDNVGPVYVGSNVSLNSHFSGEQLLLKTPRAVCMNECFSILNSIQHSSNANFIQICKDKQTKKNHSSGIPPQKAYLL